MVAVVALGLVGWALARHAAGSLVLAPLVADGMVLQRDTSATVAGRTLPGWPVLVVGTWGTVDVVRAAADGTFRATLRSRGPGGPHRLLVWAGATAVVRNVFVGEVWLCSGQSNMEQTVEQAAPSVTPDVPSDPPIRLFTVGLAIADTPQASCRGRWQPASVETVRAFSAVCWHFGRALHDALGMPIGLVAASAGGTEIELWTSERGLRTVPEIAAELDRAGAAHTVAAAAPSIDATPSAPPPEPGETTSTGPTQAPSTTPSTAPPPEPGVTPSTAPPPEPGVTTSTASPPAPAEATPPTPAAADAPPPAPSSPPSESVVAPEPLPAASPAARAETPDTPALPSNVPADARRRFGPPPKQWHALLWNAMIAPLVPYTFAGVVWYQGEANVARAAQYARVFPAMIRDWRAAFDRDLPFGFVQLPVYGGYRPRGLMPELRDAQRRALATPNTGMVVAIDLGDPKDVHAADKAVVGARLAAWALRSVYGRGDVADAGPLYRAMRVEGPRVRVFFDHATGGLVAPPIPIGAFELAADDRQWKPALAEIQGDTVVVRSPWVERPVAVRFAWADVPVLTIRNRAGLPASPFRSDDWPGITDGSTWRATRPAPLPPAVAPSGVTP
jgi:sialate O-acetylesterase